jgi:hypothetical protein
VTLTGGHHQIQFVHVSVNGPLRASYVWYERRVCDTGRSLNFAHDYFGIAQGGDGLRGNERSNFDFAQTGLGQSVNEANLLGGWNEV